MTNKKKVEFQIDSIDPMAQGVSKITDKITFIQKSLPGEKGQAVVFKENKKIQFAKIESFTKTSEDRVNPLCKHYEACGGCHYLHTNYENEIKIKENALKDIFIRLNKIDGLPEISLMTSPKRDGYRNRVQLHYLKKNNILGFYRQDNSGIENINECLMLNEKVNNKFQEIKKSWKNLVKNQRPKGHIEIYQKDQEVQVAINQRYAHGGFSQVYESMNQKMKVEIDKYIKELEFNSCFDLFGGNGNLSVKLKVETQVIDASPSAHINLQNPLQQYHEINLFDENHLEKLKGLDKECELLILDPPRSGYKDLDKFYFNHRPKHIIYVSCNAQTMARDLKNLRNSGIDFEINKLYMMDFFPGTKHFETMAFISIK